jgi:hypothetical protein
MLSMLLIFKCSTDRLHAEQGRDLVGASFLDGMLKRASCRGYSRYPPVLWHTTPLCLEYTYSYRL